jgi:hypothetical protein
MATESPLFHDGGQCQAAVDLSANQFYVVTISGARQVNLQTTAGAAAYGILQNKPGPNQAADVGILGVSKAAAGAAVAAGAALQVDGTGRLITLTGTNRRVATAIEAATAAGQLITVALNAPFGAIS